MYGMLKSGIKARRIKYAEDTTRTLTELSYISSATVNLMDRTGYRAINMSNGFSVDMRTLAAAVAKFLSWKFGIRPIEFIPCPPDKSIRYGQASFVINDSDEVFSVLRSSEDMNVLASEVIAEKDA